MRLSSQLCLNHNGCRVRRAACIGRSVREEADFVFRPDPGVDSRLLILVTLPLGVLDGWEGVQGQRTVLVGLLGGFGLAFEGGEFEGDGEVEVGAEEEDIAMRDVGLRGLLREWVDCWEGVAVVVALVAFFGVDGC